jgi:hypothetical protein
MTNGVSSGGVQQGKKPLSTRVLHSPMRVAQTPKNLRHGICRNVSARIAHGFVREESRYVVDNAGLGFDRHLVRGLGDIQFLDCDKVRSRRKGGKARGPMIDIEKVDPKIRFIRTGTIICSALPIPTRRTHTVSGRPQTKLSVPESYLGGICRAPRSW